MKKNSIGGIDVGARSFTMCVEYEGKRRKDGEFSNDPGGWKKAAKVLTRGGRKARVCLEATGVYHLDLALYLSGQRGIEVMVANPRAAKDFARAQMKRAKTDRVDAQCLLEFAARMRFVAWTPPSKQALGLRAITRRIQALHVTRTQELNRIHAAEQSEQLPESLRAASREHIEFLEHSIHTLKQEAVRLIGEDQQLQRKLELLCSIVGICEVSAIRIVAELAVLPQDMSVRQWVAHAGLDPRRFESGSSVRRPTRISRTGNAHLRTALYMPALVAIRHDESARRFFERLVARGKTKKQAVIAVMRKRLHAIYGMFQADQPYQPEKSFSLAA